MLLVLTKQDLAQLSPELRAELIKLLFSKSESGYDEHMLAGQSIADSLDQQAVWDDAPPWPELSEKSDDHKRVIEINLDEAIALLGNLSAKSIETLKKFAAGEAVPLDSLVGPGKDYKNLNNLKRSFVGAVNRRLRTVTRNRSAVLFGQVEVGDGVSITVRPLTAEALKQAFEQISARSKGTVHSPKDKH